MLADGTSPEAVVTAPPMLADGSNPEAVEPDPPLGWKSKDDLKDVVLYGKLGSNPTCKIRAYLILYDMPHRFNDGGKPGTDYKKSPVMDVAGRQVNDSLIILSNLVPALGLQFNKEWEEKITFVLDTTMRTKITASDAFKFAKKFFGLPACCCCMGGAIASMLHKMGKRNIAMGLGHKVGDEVEIAKEFKAGMGSNPFFGGSEPGTVDVSMYGFLAPMIFVGVSFSDGMITGAGLEDWVQAMQKVIPLEKLFTI